MKLYDFSVAPNPRRVRIFVAEKGLNIPVQEIDLYARQSRTPEFLKKNPAGQVPLLELDDGSYLAESVAICRYLEGLHPDPNLMGRDTASRHLSRCGVAVWNWNCSGGLTAISRTPTRCSRVASRNSRTTPKRNAPTPCSV